MILPLCSSCTIQSFDGIILLLLYPFKKMWPTVKFGLFVICLHYLVSMKSRAKTEPFFIDNYHHVKYTNTKYSISSVYRH